MSIMKITKTPYHAHDCNRCVYLGSELYKDEIPFNYYYCDMEIGIELIARHDIEGAYMSHLKNFVDTCSDSQLAHAKRAYNHAHDQGSCRGELRF